jgi:hypothetical protein
MTIHSSVGANTKRQPPPPAPFPQFDPGDKTGYVQYTLLFTSASGTQWTGYVISTNTPNYATTDNGSPYNLYKYNEYYNIANMITSLRGASAGASLKLTPSSHGWPPIPPGGAITNFSNVYVANGTEPVTNLSWNPADTPSGALSDGLAMAVGFTNLSYSVDTNTWTGWIDWWSLGPSAPETPLILHTNPYTMLNYGSAPTPGRGSGNSWYYAQESVNSIHLP